jgi:hypothetical protein
MMQRAEELVRASDRERQAARDRLTEASRRLLESGTDVADYARTVADVQPWIGEGTSSDVGVAGLGIGDVARRLNASAVQTTFALAAGLHIELRDKCKEAVDAVTQVRLPKAIWSTSSIAQASTLAIREDAADAWAVLVKSADLWDACHQAAALLNECGTLTAELQFDAGCSTVIGTRYLGWVEATAGAEELKRIPGPLKIRYAADHRWMPGCWLKSDHDRLAEAKPKRGLFARSGR